MRMDELQQGLWGYKKDSVYHYIVSLEERASERIAEKDAAMETLKAEAKQQLETQENLLQSLQEENTALRRNQSAVFEAMQRTRQYAEELKAESERQQRVAEEKFSRFVQQKTQELDEYLKEIQQLRTLVRRLLRDFDGKLGEAERTMSQLAARAPRVQEGETQPSHEQAAARTVDGGQSVPGAPERTARAPETAGASSQAPGASERATRAPETAGASARAPGAPERTAHAPETAGASVQAPGAPERVARAPEIAGVPPQAPGAPGRTARAPETAGAPSQAPGAPGSSQSFAASRAAFTVLPGTGGPREAAAAASGTGPALPKENEGEGRSWKTISFT